MLFKINFINLVIWSLY